MTCFCKAAAVLKILTVFLWLSSHLSWLDCALWLLEDPDLFLPWLVQLVEEFH